MGWIAIITGAAISIVVSTIIFVMKRKYVVTQEAAEQAILLELLR